MTKERIQQLIQDIATMCQAEESGDNLNLDQIEEHVETLSHEVTALDLASDATLKGELSSLDGMLSRLGDVLRQVQNSLTEQMVELNGHKQALSAYSRVANNNLLH